MMRHEMVSSEASRLQRFDRLQQRRPALGFAVAVIKKFSEDQAGQLAALIAYYAFLSLFPLLLVLVTVLGFVLQGNGSLQNDIFNSTLRDIPVIGSTIKSNIHALHGSPTALVVGLVAAVWAGLGVTQASQSAFNRIWNVPFRDRPDFLRSRLRGLVLLGLLGGLSILSIGLTALVSIASIGPVTSVLGQVVAVLINLALFLAAFRLLTAAEVSWRELVPGAVMAALFFQLLQLASSYLIATRLHHASEVYGTFGFVLGMIGILYLAAQMTLLAAEINVVHSQQLWPRSLTSPLTEGDRRALRGHAETQERVEGQDVTVTFDP
jgi:membrane protein